MIRTICSRTSSDYKRLTKHENEDAQWIIARSENVCDKPKNSLRSCPIPKRLSIATGYWSGRPTPRLNQDCCSSQGIQSESTTPGSIGDRPCDLQYAHFAARFTVSPAAGTPDVTEAPAPSNRTGWRCSASSVCRRPTSACLIDDRTLLSICSNRVVLILLVHYAEQIQNMLDCSLSQAIGAEFHSHFPLSSDFLHSRHAHDFRRPMSDQPDSARTVWIGMNRRNG